MFWCDKGHSNPDGLAVIGGSSVEPARRVRRSRRGGPSGPADQGSTHPLLFEESHIDCVPRAVAHGRRDRMAIIWLGGHFAC